MNTLSGISQTSADILERRFANPRQNDENIAHLTNEVIRDIRSSFPKNLSKTQRQKAVKIAHEIIKDHFRNSQSQPICEKEISEISSTKIPSLKNLTSMVKLLAGSCLSVVVAGADLLNIHTGVPSGKKSLCDPFYCDEGYLTDVNGTLYTQFMRNINRDFSQKDAVSATIVLGDCETIHKIGNVIKNTILPYILSNATDTLKFETDGWNGYMVEYIVKKVPTEVISQLENNIEDLHTVCTDSDEFWKWNGIIMAGTIGAACVLACCRVGLPILLDKCSSSNNSGRSDVAMTQVPTTSV